MDGRMGVRRLIVYVWVNERVDKWVDRWEGGFVHR